jgi:hypothetical protein
MATTAYEKAKARKKARTATTETGTSAYQRAKERKAKRLTTPERKSGMLALYEQNQKETAIAPETKTTISTFKSPLLQGNKSRSTLVDKQADLNNSLLSVSQTGKMPKRIATQPLITPELGTKLSESYKKNFTDMTKPLPISPTPSAFRTGTEATGLEKGLYSAGKGLARASGDVANVMGTVTQYVSEIGDRLAGRKTSEKNVIAEYFNKINNTADTLYNSMDMATDRGTGKTQEFVNGAIENCAYLVPTIASSLMSGGGTAATGAMTLNNTAKTGIQYASKMVQSLKGMTAFMTQAAGGYMQDSKDKGDNITTQMLKGTYGGLLEGITETIPFGYLEKLLGITGTKPLIKEGVKKLLATYGKNALANIITNVVQEIVVDPLAKTGTNLIGGEKSKLLGPGGILDAEVAERSALGALGLSLITIGLGLPVADIYNAAKYESFNKKLENMKKVLATEKEQTLNKTTTDMGLQAGQVSTGEQTAENAPSTPQEAITATITPEQGNVSRETVKEETGAVEVIPETVYHGTDAEFEVFDKDKLGSKTGAKSAKQAFFFSDNQELADTYRVPRGVGASGWGTPHNVDKLKSFIDDLSDADVEKLALAAEDDFGGGIYTDTIKNMRESLVDFLDAYTEGEADGYTDIARIAKQVFGEETVNKAISEDTSTKRGRIVSASIDMKNPLVIEDLNKYKDKKMSTAVQDAIDGGYDGLIVKNTKDALNGKDVSGNVYAVFNTEQIKTTKPDSTVSKKETVGERIKKAGDTKIVAKEKAVVEANKTPIEDRTYKEVGKPKVKSYQWKHPELKPFIQEEAAAIHTELRNVIKGERYTLPEDAPELHPEKMDASAVGGVQTTGFKGYASASLRRIQEITKQTTGDQASYEEIKLALEQIIHDEGAENNALAKRIELIIDQNLTNGVTRDDFGKQYPNTEYIKTKRQVEGKEVTVEREPQEDDELPIMEEDFVKPVKKNVPVQFEGTKPGEAGYVPTPTEVVASKKGSLTLPKAKAKKTAFAFESERQESIYQANKGVKQPTFMDKIKEGITETLHAMTRPIATLPVNAENAQLYEKLQLLPKLKNMVSDDTVRTLDTGILKKDNIPDYKSFDNFSRTVYLKDLAQDAKLGYELPNEMTPETVKSELERLDKESTAGIKKALSERKARWQEIVDAKVKAYADIGMDISDVYSREDYFHHQVLEYMNAKEYMGLSGTGKKLATPPTRGFEKARSGKYTGMTNTDYLQAEYEVMAQMKYDTEVAKIIKLIESSKYNIVAKVKQDAKDKGLKDWHEAIPEGYDTWQPKEGNVFYLVRTLGEEVVENALALKNMELDDVKNPKVKAILQDVIDRLGESKEFLAMGGKRTELVLKQEVIDTLNNLTKMATKPIAAVRFSRALLNSWKRWVLTGNPRSILKYNIRNFSGDLDVTMAMDGKALRQVPKAMKELQDAFTNGKFTPELKSWYDQGAYQELLASQEIGEVNKMKPFERFREKTTLEKIATPLKNYERFTTKITNYREAVLRYAVYLESLADQKANGKVTNYGASKKSIIDALETPESKAHKISNEILGAYDEVSELGVVLARHLIPFYRFQEVNFKRYVNLFKNAATGGEKAKTVAGAVLKVGGKTAWTLAKVMLTLMMVSAWNTIVYPELEETLPDDVKSRSHIILGKNPKTGETIYFTRLGALQDFLEWFGLENATQDVIDILNGKKTVKEQITDMVRSPINKVVSSLSPYYKTTGELLTGKKLYPDIWNQGTINDKWQYAAQTFGLQKEYDVLAGKPHRPYAESLLEAVVYKSDPQEAAYWDIIDAKYDYLEKIGEGQSGSFARSKRSMALYYYKMALRYGDEKAQEKYLAKYKELGGTESGMNRSLASMDPLYGLSDKERADFLATLTESERETLKTAQQYYKTIKSNGTK